MTHEQINKVLANALNQAVTNGWYLNGVKLTHASYDIERGSSLFFTIKTTGGEISETWNLYELIYDKDFAKAIWGNKEIEVFTGFGYDPGLTDDDPGDEYNTYSNEVAWKHHLMHMVTADDPIEYLRANMGVST
jgi:hypothetical protein